MNRLAIIDGIRTPFIKAGTLFKDLPAYELGRLVVSEIVARTGIDKNTIDEVIMGCVGQPAEAANVARVIALNAGIPERVPARTVHRNCASGLESITSAYEQMLAGRGEVFIVGGAESMSNYPMLFPKTASENFAVLQRAKTLGEKLKAFVNFRPADFRPQIAVILGLTDPTCGMIMGDTAEVLAKEFHVAREEQDKFSLASHQKVVASREKLREEMMTVYLDGTTGRGDPRGRPKGGSNQFVIDDNGVREGQTMEALGKLRPIFDRKFGTVTAGNSSQITDGAVALLVMSEAKAKALDYKPLGYLQHYSYAGLDPRRMGLGPAYAIPLALRKAGRKLSDMQLIEINEAFAVQVMACEQLLASKKFAKEHLNQVEPVGEIDRAKLNVNGGAVALGHPVGATGARVVLTLLKELQRRNQQIGIASLCVGGGQGAALVLERN
ncbi:MAG: thiolase family protein [Verrucomicrobiae bacterium]|nr:thiolase family protein [Verrucomicrobiae bacterium]